MSKTLRQTRLGGSGKGLGKGQGKGTRRMSPPASRPPVNRMPANRMPANRTRRMSPLAMGTPANRMPLENNFLAMNAPPPPVLLRSCTRSSMLFNSLHGPHNEANRNKLKRRFKKDDKIIPAIYQLLPPHEHPDEIIFELKPKETGVYLNWKSNGETLIHVSIHTGVYAEGTTARMLDRCVEKGNMHIVFDFMPLKDEVKLSVDNRMKVNHNLPGLNPDDSPKDEIIARIIRIFKQYIDETPFPLP